MRLLHTFNDDHAARKFSNFLKREGIENGLEISKNTDWGSDDYGTLSCKVWVIEEDAWESAQEWLNLFLNEPNNVRFKDKEVHIPLLEEAKKPITRLTTTKKSPQRTWTLTYVLIALCSVLFVFSELSDHPLTKSAGEIPQVPLFNSSIKKTLLFDYPLAYQLSDQLAKTYGLEALVTPSELPKEGQKLYLQLMKTPYWEGFYQQLITYFKKGELFSINAPLFEKFHQGQFWRPFSPILLHNDILHLFFNMVWLLVLGAQMEKKIGIGRFAFFILLTGIFSNTCQYFMSGSNFIGFSGVLCAMIAFVWFRQKNAPWEGYQLLPSTMAFITIFIFALAGIQTISFLLQIYNKQPFAPPIANTAHLSGALGGYILSKFNFFSWKGNK